jgi:hypothetical protein
MQADDKAECRRSRGLKSASVKQPLSALCLLSDMGGLDVVPLDQICCSSLRLPLYVWVSADCQIRYPRPEIRMPHGRYSHIELRMRLDGASIG